MPVAAVGRLGGQDFRRQDGENAKKRLTVNMLLETPSGRIGRKEAGSGRGAGGRLPVVFISGGLGEFIRFIERYSTEPSMPD